VTLDSDQAGQLKSATKAKALIGLTERVAYLRLNTVKPPFDNVKLRLAAAYAIDKEGLVDGLLGGFDKPVSQLLTPASFGWVEGLKGPSYDLAKAKALVAEAGPAAKAEIELSTSPVFDQRIVQAIQQQLNDAGLNVKIAMSDMASYLKRSQAGPEATSTLSFGRWSCACQDADGVLFPLIHKSSGWSAYRNPKADSLLEEARQTLDKDKRLAAYKQVHEIIAAEAPLVPLYQAVVIYGATKNLQFKPTPNESMFLNRMSWTD
jgi:peptide/nickel transport system substrate-binding protein